MSEKPLERCFNCDDLTGHAGKGEDSRYDVLGLEPYCDECWDKQRQAFVHEGDGTIMGLGRLLAAVVARAEKAENTVGCGFCDWTTDRREADWRGRMAEHLLACPKHPMAEVVALLDEARACVQLGKAEKTRADVLAKEMAEARELYSAAPLDARPETPHIPSAVRAMVASLWKYTDDRERIEKERDEWKTATAVARADAKGIEAAHDELAEECKKLFVERDEARAACVAMAEHLQYIVDVEDGGKSYIVKAGDLARDANPGQSLLDELAKLREALEELIAVQNGPPLPTWARQWNRATALANAALGRPATEAAKENL